jgi:arsenate reductase-like glutaredoxin family protein
MIIQIFGTRKCRETQKALRFFKERGIQIDFRDLNIKGMSKGELEKLKRFYRLEELIDSDGKEYEKRNLKYINHDIEEELLNDPLLFVTPVVRQKDIFTLGYHPEDWKEWL